LFALPNYQLYFCGKVQIIGVRQSSARIGSCPDEDTKKQQKQSLRSKTSIARVCITQNATRKT
jgi:hypothetical protein